MAFCAIKNQKHWTCLLEFSKVVQPLDEHCIGHTAFWGHLNSCERWQVVTKGRLPVDTLEDYHWWHTVAYGIGTSNYCHILSVFWRYNVHTFSPLCTHNLLLVMQCESASFFIHVVNSVWPCQQIELFKSGIKFGEVVCDNEAV